MIPIYESEKQLESLILSSASFGLLSDPILCTPEESEKIKFGELLKSIADANPNQFDLYYLKSVLVSVGWNKNDDVFPNLDTWNARHTPVDKPFNYMHDCKDIIGHMTSSIVVSDNKIIDDNTPLDDVPDTFDVIVGSVLYKTWSDKNLQERMDKIIDEIKDGKWKVSMECLFSNFDYAIISPDGKNNFIKRGESSAFLTKHLRVYGGTGEYEGYKIGRLLRSFIFSGKGLVDKPANPKSDVIGYSDKNETKIFVGAVEASINSLQSEEKIMSDTVNKEQYDSLQEELNGVKAKLTEKDSTIADLQKKLSELEPVKASLETERATVQEKDKQIGDLSKKLEEVQAKYDGVQTELNTIKSEAVKAARLARILERDVDEAKAKSLLEKFASVSDEMFNELVEALPAKKGEDEASETDVTSAEEVVDNLDDVEVEPTGSSASTDTEDTLLKSVASWVSGNLRSTAGKKE